MIFAISYTSTCLDSAVTLTVHMEEWRFSITLSVIDLLAAL